MHKPEANCNEIVEKMALSITNQDLQILFVSTQRNNAKLCSKFAIELWGVLLFSYYALYSSSSVVYAKRLWEVIAALVCASKKGPLVLCAEN